MDDDNDKSKEEDDDVTSNRNNDDFDDYGGNDDDNDDSFGQDTEYQDDSYDNNDGYDNYYNDDNGDYYDGDYDSDQISYRNHYDNGSESEESKKMGELMNFKTILVYSILNSSTPIHHINTNNKTTLPSLHCASFFFAYTEKGNCHFFLSLCSLKRKKTVSGRVLPSF